MILRWAEVGEWGSDDLAPMDGMGKGRPHRPTGPREERPRRIEANAPDLDGPWCAPALQSRPLYAATGAISSAVR